MAENNTYEGEVVHYHEPDGVSVGGISSVLKDPEISYEDKGMYLTMVFLTQFSNTALTKRNKSMPGECEFIKPTLEELAARGGIEIEEVAEILNRLIDKGMDVRSMLDLPEGV